MVYSPRFRDFRSEKRYGGGQANDLFIFDMATNDAKRITDHTRADRDPMWIGNMIYFNSDRDDHFNLYSYDVAKGSTVQLTTNKTWDVRWPSSDNQGRIVYELNGELQIFETKSKKNTPISITVPDDGLNTRPSRVAAGNQIFSYGLSPKGERAVFEARGDIFTAPIEKGPSRNLTNSSNAHDKLPSWSPDGSQIAFISDKSGEEELYVIAQDGSKPAERLTTGGKAMRYAPAWAPDGKLIAFTDKDGKVYTLTVADKKLTQVADSKRGLVLDYTWSPKGNYLAFTLTDDNNASSVYVWSSKDNQLRRVTTSAFNESNPAWDPQGNYLFYLSTREFAPMISGVEFNYASNKDTGIFAIALRKDVKHPFPAESDEVTITKDGPKEGEKKPDAKEGEKKPDEAKPAADLTIDFEGIESRAARVPVQASNYGGLSAKAGHLIYGVGPAFYYGRQGDAPPSLRIYSIKERKETTLAEGIRRLYALRRRLEDTGQAGAGLLAFSTRRFKATKRRNLFRPRISTLIASRLKNGAQIFSEVWRRYRDFFYAPNMHGYDWEALREQYEPQLKYVAHRSDLNYVISEMISELTVQHAYIEGGDFNIPPRPQVGLPGARLELDREAGRYQITKIFAGQNEEDIYRSPLTEIGVDVKVGDYVLAIDGEELKPNEDPYRLLRNKS